MLAARRSIHGIVDSHSRAMTTIAEAMSAAVTERLLRAARRAREEDDAVGVPRDLAEVLDHRRLAAAVARGDGNGGPHPRVELAPELVDEALLVGGDLEVTFGDQLFAVARPHP